MAKLTQEELLDIFDELKKLVKPYEKGSVRSRFDMQGKYDLWSEQPVEIAGRKYPDTAFVGLIVQSSYVGFYFMPVYTRAEVKPQLGPELLKTLKGKSCFHIRSTDKTVLKQVKDALKIGYDLYKKSGWIS